MRTRDAARDRDDLGGHRLKQAMLVLCGFPPPIDLANLLADGLQHVLQDLIDGAEGLWQLIHAIVRVQRRPWRRHPATPTLSATATGTAAA
eukprot:CAMPEP_0204059802 /NCGR_PEP_ID=MMETSP0360-20130528/138624_1 /ASSEMBLY_ACC=CAM_ASM_000342 /TAXON_ID=268821 /ORGANISM="Scrippsiella Hangoei, Strain SHTV-5" /LENGTH=90 /DNA_ID=CAMNT_0051007433 /DNA_START=1 /DNA_END=270 /DNA_ORIENTATION=-